MRLSVLIPTWRRPDSLARGLRALAAQERLPDQLVIVARSDDEQTRDLLANVDVPFPLAVVAPPRPGVIAALNCGFHHADGDVIAITDDDTEPELDWLTRIERHFEDDSGLGALGGRDIVVGTDASLAGDPTLPVGRVLPFGRVTGYHHLGGGPPREVDIVKGANMAVRRRALDGLRISTDLRGSGAEHHWEIDLSLAIKQAGWRVLYDPGVRVLHHEAERHGGQREELMGARERFDAVHNQTLALLRHLRGARRIVAAAYAFLVGTRADPGPVLAVEAALRRRGPFSSVRARMRTATAARCAALRRWRRAG